MDPGSTRGLALGETLGPGDGHGLVDAPAPGDAPPLGDALGADSPPASARAGEPLAPGAALALAVGDGDGLADGEALADGEGEGDGPRPRVVEIVSQ